MKHTKTVAAKTLLLNLDIDTAISQSSNFKAFEIRLKDMGYIIQRGEEYAHYSIKAPSWQRAISVMFRFKSLSMRRLLCLKSNTEK